MLRVLIALTVTFGSNAVARADSPRIPDPADCFCSNRARDLNIGHFEDDGVFVVDVPLTPGPDEIRRTAGERISGLGLGIVGSGPHLLADYAVADGDGADYCAQALTDADPHEARLTHVCRFWVYLGSPEHCTESLSVARIATLFPRFAHDDRCYARIRAIGIEDPNDPGCSGGATGGLALALLSVGRCLRSASRGPTGRGSRSAASRR